jgi:hypothetical protein
VGSTSPLSVNSASAEMLQVPMPIASPVRDHFLEGLLAGQGSFEEP